MSMPLTAAQVDQLQQHMDSRDFVTAYELLELWTRDSTDQDMQAAHTWFLGAGDINRGEGPFSALALAFNQRQGLLRGYPVSIDDNQGASDLIAERVIEHAITRSEIPDMTQIVLYEPEGAAYLFSSHPDPDETTRTVGANWTGTLLISPFGIDKTELLLSTGESEVVMDSMDDLKNVLFAYDSFKEALWAAFKFDPSWGSTCNAIQAMFSLPEGERLTGVLNAIGPNWTDAVVSDMVAGRTAADAFELMRLLGKNDILDQLMSAWQGQSVIGTTDDTFVANASSFFGSISGETLRSTGLERLDAKSVDELVALANADIKYRNALQGLSVFALDLNASLYTDRNLSLFDETTRQGSLTQKYIKDRATFLHGLAEREIRDHLLQGEFSEYRDLASGEIFSFDAVSRVNPAKQYLFGTRDADNLEGMGNDDHLYGGAGDDKLTGLGGADYMEGGEGDDTYIAGDGDTILDTDGFGRVLFGDTVLYGGVSSANSNVYQSRDGKLTYTLVDNTLTVTGDEGNLTIENFNNLDLGIVLENTQPAPTVDPIGLMEGDSSALTISLGQPAGENGAVYELTVSDPDLLTLSGDGVEVLDAASGRYRVSVAAGASSLALQANALANDGNNIVNAVSLKVNEVIYKANGQSDSGRQLTQVDLIIDDTHYDPAHAVHDYEPVINAMEGGRNMTGGDPGGVLTYYYGLDDGEMIINAGELTRTYGGGGADDFDSTYAYDYFDGSTLDEIAAYYQQYHPDVDYAVALQWATDNRALREAGNFNDWSEGGAGNDYLYGGDGEDYLDGGADKDYINGGGGDDILIAGDGAENLLNGSGQNDLLIGGAGVDYLFGDAHVVPVDRYPSGDEWFVTREGHDVIFHNCSLSFGWTGGDMDGDDRIYAGAGNYHVVVV